MTVEEFNATFEQIQPQLKSYILRMTASVEDTEDILQDTWLKASEKLDTFKGDSSLKSRLVLI